jgi:hypothetical protein
MKLTLVDGLATVVRFIDTQDLQTYEKKVDTRDKLLAGILDPAARIKKT